MMEFPYYTWAVTVLNALPSWPNPTNLEEVRQAICDLLDLDSGWAHKRPELAEGPVWPSVAHAGAMPTDSKLYVRWKNHEKNHDLWFDADKAAALARSVPDPGYAWH